MIWREGDTERIDTMQFPAEGVRIIDAFLAQPHWLAKAQGTDDDRRQLTLAICEQCAWQIDPHFGAKSADSGRPQSKDAVAFKTDSGRLWCWDWQNGSTRLRQVQAGAEAEDITGQHFLPVAPLDHLGNVLPPPAEEGGTGGSASDDLQAAVLLLQNQLRDIRTLVSENGIRISDVHAATERQYADLCKRLDLLIASMPGGYSGTVSSRLLGTMRVDLQPQRRDGA